MAEDKFSNRYTKHVCVIPLEIGSISKGKGILYMVESLWHSVKPLAPRTRRGFDRLLRSSKGPEGPSGPPRSEFLYVGNSKDPWGLRDPWGPS